MIRRFSVLLLAAALFLTACATVPVTGRRQLSLISAPEMAAMGADGYAQFLQESTLSRDAQQTQMVNRVGADIAAAAEAFMREHGMEGEIENYGWEFNLVEADTVVKSHRFDHGGVTERATSGRVGGRYRGHRAGDFGPWSNRAGHRAGDFRQWIDFGTAPL